MKVILVVCFLFPLISSAELSERAANWNKCLAVTMVKTAKSASGMSVYNVNQDEPDIVLTYSKSKFFQFNVRKKPQMRPDQLQSSAEELEDSAVSEAISYAILDLIAVEKKTKKSPGEMKHFLEKKLQACLDTDDKVISDLIRNELNELVPLSSKKTSVKSMDSSKGGR